MKRLVQSQAGFTLIEIIIVIALIGLLTALVLPRGIQAGISSAALDTEASKIAGSIRLARQKAIASGVPYRISFAAEGYSLYPSDQGPPSKPTEQFDEHVILSLRLGGNNFIEFNSSGETHQTGSVDIIDRNSGQRAKRLRINGQGSVDIQTP